MFCDCLSLHQSAFEVELQISAFKRYFWCFMKILHTQPTFTSQHAILMYSCFVFPEKFREYDIYIIS